MPGLAVKNIVGSGYFLFFQPPGKPLLKPASSSIIGADERNPVSLVMVKTNNALIRRRFK